MNVMIVQIALPVILFVHFVYGGLLGAGIRIHHVYFTIEQFSLKRNKINAWRRIIFYSANQEWGMAVAEQLPSDQRRCSGQRAALTLLPAAQSMVTVTQGKSFWHKYRQERFSTFLL